jgi:cellulose synthase/poly-beta-1,6-N-acetylglucosamine synthase-like glycosyltransferase
MSWLQIRSRASLLNRIDSLDSFALVLIGAGAVGLGLPFIANAANFGYRKKVFQEVNGFQGIEQFVSGDDDLFLLKMRQKTNWQVAFANDPAACVWTRPASTWKHFFSQRIRWASKGTIYPLLLQTLELAIYTYYAMLALSPLLALVRPDLLFFFITSFTIKVLLDGLLLRGGHKALGRKWNYLDFLIGEIFNLAYILFVGIAGMFGKFQWKDRTYYRGKVMAKETATEVEKRSI